MRKQIPLNPVDVAFAKKHCAGVQVHCLRCQNFVVIGFEGFLDEWLVMDLPRRRRFRCTRCGGARVETRPNYPQRNDRKEWIGLAQSGKKSD